MEIISSLITHVPETYRLVCLRSLVPEEEERSFGDLRPISKNTSNRQPSHVIDNAVLRFRAQQKYHEKQNSFQRQESIVSQQTSLLNDNINTTIPITSIMKNPYKFQTHLQRISDFLLCGKGIWWNNDETSVIFYDVTDRPVASTAGPPLHHLRSYSEKEEKTTTFVNLGINVFRSLTNRTCNCLSTKSNATMRES